MQEFDNAPLPAVFDLLEYWAEHPPQHIIAAAMAGITPKKQRKNKSKENRMTQKEDKSKKPKINPYNPQEEAAMPEFVQQARKMERERRLKEMQGSTE